MRNFESPGEIRPRPDVVKKRTIMWAFGHSLSSPIELKLIEANLNDRINDHESHQVNPPTKHLLAGIVFAAAGLTACSNSSKSESVNPDAPVTRQSESLVGIWEQSGYGNILVVDSEGADFYQYTRQGCLNVGRLDSSDLEELFTDP